MHYEVSGEFDQRLKLRQAVIKVATSYAWYSLLGLIVIVWLWYRGTFSDSSDQLSVRGFMMAMGSAYGLL